MTETSQELLLRLFISMGMGFLIGLEREYAKHLVDKDDQFAGVRTYTLVALFGFLSAYLAERSGDLLFITAFVGFIALVIVTYWKTAKEGSYGITTELAGLVTFLLGAMVFEGEVLVAVIVTVVITLLLALKLKLHAFIRSLTAEEVRSFILFTIISAVVLPLLPDEPFGPSGVWNLHEIWTMVVLVTGISFAGYLLSKILGTGKSSFLVGVVGGLVSSTAVTLGLARRSREKPGGANTLAAVGIIAATATLYPRILLETWAVNRSLALQLALPVAFITLVAFGMAYLIHRKRGGSVALEAPPTNPLNFAVALQFGVIYMAVQWLMELVSTHYSAQGLYAGSLVFGATDMDAITLSIARRTLEPGTLQGVMAILLATLSNTVMKFLIVLIVGDKSLRKWVGTGFGAITIATVLAMVVLRLLS